MTTRAFRYYKTTSRRYTTASRRTADAAQAGPAPTCSFTRARTYSTTSSFRRWNRHDLITEAIARLLRQSKRANSPLSQSEQTAKVRIGFKETTLANCAEPPRSPSPWVCPVAQRLQADEPRAPARKRGARGVSSAQPPGRKTKKHKHNKKHLISYS